jgi:hypothetical protein
MNCKRDVVSADSKLFAECFVCPDCYTVAERMYIQGERELKHLLVTLKELIRLAIIRGELQLEEFVPNTTIPVDTVVDALAELSRKKKEAAACPTPRRKRTRKLSKKTLKRSARTAGGSVSSDFTEAAASSQETSSTETPPTGTSDNA